MVRALYQSELPAKRPVSFGTNRAGFEPATSLLAASYHKIRF